MNEAIVPGRRAFLGPILAALLLASVVALAIAAAVFSAAPAEAAPHVGCGKVLRVDTTLNNDLTDCLGNGLNIGADGITVDLNGHTIDGTGLGFGIRNNGFDNVQITNSSPGPAYVKEFDYGIKLERGTIRNTVNRLTVLQNEVAGVRLFDADRNQITNNHLNLQANEGLVLLKNSTGNGVSNNSIGNNGGQGIWVEASGNNTFTSNRVTNNSDGGIYLLLRSNSNEITDTTLLGLAQGDAAITISESNTNIIQGSTINKFSDAGLKVVSSYGTQLLSNTIRGTNDSGIFLQLSNGSTIKDNDVRLSAGGIELNSSPSNRLESNKVFNSTGIGFELEDSPNNDLVLNTANANGAEGISVGGDSPTFAYGNLLDRNTASDNLGDGIVVGGSGHTITANTATNNSGWGIYAAPGNRGTGNRASGNAEPTQCFGITCRP